MKEDLIELVLQHDDLAELDVAQRRLALRSLVAQEVGEEHLSTRVKDLADAIDGYGPLSEWMCDDQVTDVLINGPSEVWIDRAGSLTVTGASFAGEQELRDFIDRMLAGAGARADASHPVADARLADGSRMHVVMPPVAGNAPLVSIRKFPHQPLSIDDLVERKMLSSRQANFLVDCVSNKVSMAISGGTGSGKTTLLNALLGRVGDGERVVLIEETAELRPSCRHHVSLLAREANVEGSGAVSASSLVRAALRMRPDRIVMGEVRGEEALAGLSAMSVGHEGSMVTIHARSAGEVVERMVALALSAASGAPEESLRRKVRSALGLIVHLEREPGGRRRVTEIITCD